jgi:hypothetical protein
MPARGELNARDLPSPIAFSLLFGIPVLSVAVADAILLSSHLRHVSDRAIGIAGLAAPTLISAGISLLTCRRMRIERHTAWSMTFAAGLIALALALVVFLGLIVLASGE